MKKAFILVGHSNWGKSRTLKCLTDNNKDKRTYPIKEIEFFIRRMSNDDQPDGLLQFVIKTEKPNIIMTLCPNFQEGKLTIKILENLVSKNYQLFFFVLEYKYNNRSQFQKISEEEIDKLRPYSHVIEIFTEKNSPDYLRAQEFRKFIERHLST